MKPNSMSTSGMVGAERPYQAHEAGEGNKAAKYSDIPSNRNSHQHLLNTEVRLVRGSLHRRKANETERNQEGNPEVHACE